MVEVTLGGRNSATKKMASFLPNQYCTMILRSHINTVTSFKYLGLYVSGQFRPTTQMKRKVLIITTIVFFLAINTTCFWEGKLGLLAMPALLILILVYIGQAIVFLKELIFAIKERFVDRYRILTLGLLTAVLCLTFLFPFGIINFEKLSGNDLLVAQREGSANCMTTLKLKDNNTFTEKSICFGVREIRGNYKIVHDTIYFENVDLGRHHDSFYQFAVIRPSNINQDQKHFDLVRFRNLNDTTGYELSIIKNDLNKSTDKSRTPSIGFMQ